MDGQMLVVVVASLLTIGAATWLLAPIARGMGERLRGGRAGDAELEALRAQVQALRDDLLDEQQRTRTELVERLEFAERLLALQRDPSRLPGR